MATEANGQQVVDNVQYLIKELDESFGAVLEGVSQGAIDEQRRAEAAARVIHDIYMFNVNLLMVFKMNPEVPMETFFLLKQLVIDLVTKVAVKVHMISNRIGAKSCSLSAEVSGAPAMKVQIDL